MKIYNRQDFLKLGVCLYCKGSQWAFYDMCIKTESIFDANGKGIDFFYQSLCDIEKQNGIELTDEYEEMLKTGASKQINKSTSRDGCFDDDDIFLVYELKDISNLYCIMKVLCQKSNQNIEHFNVDLAKLKEPFVCKKP